MAITDVMVGSVVFQLQCPMDISGTLFMTSSADLLLCCDW